MCYYNGRAEKNRSYLCNLKFEDFTSIEIFVSKKFEFFDNYCPGLTINRKTLAILECFPIKIMNEFENAPKRYFNEKDTF